jgi:hypothetical protein
MYNGVFWRGGDPKVYGSMNAIVLYLRRNSGISIVLMLECMVVEQTMAKIDIALLYNILIATIY